MTVKIFCPPQEKAFPPSQSALRLTAPPKGELGGVVQEGSYLPLWGRWHGGAVTERVRGGGADTPGRQPQWAVSLRSQRYCLWGGKEGINYYDREKFPPRRGPVETNKVMRNNLPRITYITSKTHIPGFALEKERDVWYNKCRYSNAVV